MHRRLLSAHSWAEKVYFPSFRCLINAPIRQHLDCWYFLIDSEQPEFSFCPDDLSLELDNVGDSSVIPTWPVPVATDNSGTATLTTDYDGRAFDVDTTTIVTYTATDPTGNVRECVFSVTINSKFLAVYYCVVLERRKVIDILAHLFLFQFTNQSKKC